MSGARSDERASPSAWSRRVPVIGLALIGCAVASYLAAAQLGIVGRVWDPIFGPASSHAVLFSSISQMLPVPDAALGAVTYALEAGLAAVGGTDRWRRDPWLVLAMGGLLALLALASVALVLIQPLVVHAGCTLCLASAAISFANAWLGWDEVASALGCVGWLGSSPQEHA